MLRLKQTLRVLVFSGLLAAFAEAHPISDSVYRRALSPDNTCGYTGAGNSGYTCGSGDVGSCCSSKGFCGSGPTYCGAGCQGAFGTCQTTSPLAPAVAPPMPTPSSSPAGNAPLVSGCPWTVPDAGMFTHSLNVDFTKLSAFPSTGLEISNVNIPAGPAPYSQNYVSANVAIADGSLQLKVLGHQSSSPVLGAQIVTSDSDILYGSVRTTAQVSSVAGTVHGFFYYGSNTNEADIEFLTEDLTTGPHYTNQPNIPGSQSTTMSKALSFNPAVELHDYRLDWLPGKTIFYVDGVQQGTLEKNVPSTPGSWVWNNWSNGGAWGHGPPSADNVLKISKIEMYYNRTGSAGSC